MKKLLLSSVALLGLSATAFAADLPSRRVAPAPYVAVPVFTWTGFYVGVNAGYGFSGGNDNNYDYLGASPLIARGPVADQLLTGGAGLPVYGSGNGNRDGFVGGGQIGYNVQFGNVVVGIEADAQYADFGRHRGGAFGAYGGGTDTVRPGVDVAVGSPNVSYLNTGLFSANSSKWFGTVRGRLGYAWDRLLIYGTGGLAFTDSGNNNGFYGGSAIPTSFFYAGNGAAAQAGYAAAGNTYATNIRGTTQRMDDVGYAVGGGVEYAFTPNLTGTIEGLYV
jgi:outer membrane immunogenic protein